MRRKMVMLEGGKTIRCANPDCGFLKGLVICRPEFSRDEALKNDVLSFCKKACFDEYYTTHPITTVYKNES